MERGKLDNKEIFARKGLKNTSHRSAILDILKQADTPLTAEEIFLILKSSDASTCLSTVYRTFDLFVAKDLVIKSNIFDDGKARYELNDMKHQHRVACLNCHKTIVIEDCPFEEFERELKKKTGFDVVQHKLELYGYCQDCRGH